MVSPGATFTAEIFTSDSGKKYLNKIVNAPVQTTNTAVSSNQPMVRQEAPKDVSKPLSPVETAKAALAKAEADEKRLIEDIKKATPIKSTTQQTNVSYQPRDYEKEARGKTRCAAICAAVQSPSGQVFAASVTEYDAWVKHVADLIYDYTFQERA